MRYGRTTYKRLPSPVLWSRTVLSRRPRLSTWPFPCPIFLLCTAERSTASPCPAIQPGGATSPRLAKPVQRSTVVHVHNTVTELNALLVKKAS